jgi:hypothetical protein
MDKFGPRLGSLGTKVYLFVPTFIGAQIDLLPWFHCVCMLRERSWPQAQK